ERTNGELVSLRKSLAVGQETFTRLSLALTQLEALERDATALRNDALRDVRAALGARLTPPPPRVSSVPPAPRPRTPDSLASMASSPPPALEPAPSAAPQAETHEASPPPAPDPPAPPAPPQYEDFRDI